MRALLVVAAVLATAGLIAAAPEPRPASWADWVGSYQGALQWSGCTVDGAKTATLDFTIVDGVASIDLSPARPGMRAMTLVADEGDAWSGRQGDVAVAIKRATKRPAPNASGFAIDLAVDLDSGCTMRARLSRPSTGVAACDQLIGWVRVASACTKLRPQSDDLAKLLATKWKPADAASCARRAATLEHALIDGGCAPHPDPRIGVRSPDCLDLAQQAGRISRCANVLPDLKTRAVSVANAVVSASQTADRSTLSVVEQQCRDTRAELIAIATKFGCP